MPSLEEMRVAGFSPEDYADDYCEVWPENWPAVTLFLSVSNQWRVGFSGAFALDYGVVFHRMDRMKLEGDDYEAMFTDIRVIEDAALQAMKKK